MGLLDRLVGKTAKPSSARPATPSSPAPAEGTPQPGASTPAGPSGNLLPQLAAARERLEKRELQAAREIYDEALAGAGDRPDVLVTISGDLGSCGYFEPIVELIAPRYDAERHGPATGLNLLQAYLALRNPEAAQHVLDILFALKRPDLEDRLWGFSNAIAELIEARRKSGTSTAPARAAAQQINLVTISRPIWSYGLEAVPALLPTKNPPLRRVAIAQLATPVDDWAAKMTQPEDAAGRFSRGFALWLAETLYFSAQYEASAAVGVVSQNHYALFPVEWTADNIRQLIDTGGKFDYVMTGMLQERSGDFALVLRLWEIKTFRQRKTFEVKWTPADADAALLRLHEQLRVFFEWKTADGLPYQPPASPTRWIHALGTSLSHFLVGKSVLAKEQLAPWPADLPAANEGAIASLAHLTLQARARELGSPVPPEQPLAEDAHVSAARDALGL